MTDPRVQNHDGFCFPAKAGQAFLPKQKEGRTEISTD
jgi:hypothetical protein